MCCSLEDLIYLLIFFEIWTLVFVFKTCEIAVFANFFKYKFLWKKNPYEAVHTAVFVTLGLSACCRTLSGCYLWFLFFLHPRTWLWNIARGISGEEVEGRLLPKSHGSGKTFPGPQALRTFATVRTLFQTDIINSLNWCFKSYHPLCMKNPFQRSYLKFVFSFPRNNCKLFLLVWETILKGNFVPQSVQFLKWIWPLQNFILKLFVWLLFVGLLLFMYQFCHELWLIFSIPASRSGKYSSSSTMKFISLMPLIVGMWLVVRLSTGLMNFVQN